MGDKNQNISFKQNSRNRSMRRRHYYIHKSSSFFLKEN